MVKRVLASLVALSATLGACMLSGCGGASNVSDLPDPTIMFLNASPDAGNVDFLLNENVAASGLGYLLTSPGFASTNYISDVDGGYDLTLRDSGGAGEYDREYVVFARNTHTVAVAIGLKNVADGIVDKKLRHVRIAVDRTAPNGNKVRLIVLHAFSRANGYQTPNIKFQTPGNNPIFKVEDIAFGASKVITVDSGAFTWQAMRQDADADVVYASTTATLEPNKIYVALVSGIEGAADASAPKITFVPLPAK